MTDTRARQAAAGDDVVAAVEAWSNCAMAAIEARDAAIARLNAEVASLRLTLGGRTFSATVPEPIGCPLPGMCVQVAEIARLREALATLGTHSNACHWHLGHDCDCGWHEWRAALAPPPASDGGEA